MALTFLFSAISSAAFSFRFSFIFGERGKCGRGRWVCPTKILWSVTALSTFGSKFSKSTCIENFESGKQDRWRNCYGCAKDFVLNISYRLITQDKEASFRTPCSERSLGFGPHKLWKLFLASGCTVVQARSQRPPPRRQNKYKGGRNFWKQILTDNFIVTQNSCKRVVMLFCEETQKLSQVMDT